MSSAIDLLFPSETYLAGRTLFHSAAAARCADACTRYGMRGLVVHGGTLEKSGRFGAFMTQFRDFDVVSVRHGGEPDLADLEALLDTARGHHAQWIVGIGGGSVLDLAKAGAGLFHAQLHPSAYQSGAALEREGIPFIAVPTTAGTGSEATPNAVITNHARKTKLSIRDRSFTARAVILDPDLLEGIPAHVSAHAGMDAIVQAYEAYTSRNATWFTDQYALKALELLVANIENLCTDPDASCREAMMLGSYLAGVAFAHARLGIIHGMAHPLGALYEIPHGLVCASCFPASIRLNRHAMGEKYAVLSGIFGGDLLKGVEGLIRSLGILNPFHGREIRDMELIIAETLASGSTAANPRKVGREDVELMLRELFSAV